MGSSNKQSTPESMTVSRSEELVDQFLDAIWMERGLSKNTLGAYRADLMTLSRSLAQNSTAIKEAEKSDLLDFIADRVESGAKPRSTARQLSSFRRFSAISCARVFAIPIPPPISKCRVSAVRCQNHCLRTKLILC